jgi:hypothetical protein
MNMSKNPQEPAVSPQPQPQSNIVDGWRIHNDSMSGGTDLPVVYLNKRTAELECEAKNAKTSREFESFDVWAVRVRLLNGDEGAVGRELVTINRVEPAEVLKQRGLNKLTREEREALGL